jgi:uncharacterized membrane protein YbhN (UPF0104 family)
VSGLVGRLTPAAKRAAALTQSRAVRVGFVLVAVALAVWALWSRWPDVVQAVHRLEPAWLAAAAVATLGNLVLVGFAWRALVADLGAKLPLALAARVFFVGQIGKYVPGSLWPLVVQAELARRHVARRVTASATFVLILLSGATALATVLLTLPFAPSGDTVTGVRWAALLVVPVAAVLHPAVLGRLLDRGLRMLGREPLEQWGSLLGTAAATAWALGAWAMAGAQVWLLAVPLGAPATWRTYALVTGGYALAWAIGLVVVIAPAGAGAREVALAALLSGVLDRGAVVVVVLLSRVLFTAADLALAAIGALTGRTAPERPSTGAPSRTP